MVDLSRHKKGAVRMPLFCYMPIFLFVISCSSHLTIFTSDNRSPHAG